MIFSENSVQQRIFEKIRERNTNDFRSIPEEKRTQIDHDAIKLTESFEYVSVPKTKWVKTAKTLYLTTVAKKELCFIEIIKGSDPQNEKKTVIIFQCGDSTLLIRYNSSIKKHNERIKQARDDERNFFMPDSSHDAMNVLRGMANSLAYQPLTGLYTIEGCLGNYKDINSFEELEEFLVEFVADYIQKFKVKDKKFYC